MLAGLLRAVLAQPDDNDSRRAYADALGHDPRAEFIRVQLREGGRGVAPRERELLQRYRHEWLGELADTVTEAGFARGFVEWVAVDAARLMERADVLFAAAPITRLSVTNAARQPVLFGVPHLLRVRSLTLTGGLDDHDAAALAESPYVRNLQRLDLAHNRITEVGLRTLAASPNLRALKGLCVAGNPCPDPCPTPLGEWPDIIWQNNALHAELLARHGPLAWLVRQDEGGLPPLDDL